jgi:hypothetical protein
MKKMNTLGYVLGLVGLGISVYVVGYAWKKGTERADK